MKKDKAPTYEHTDQGEKSSETPLGQKAPYRAPTVRKLTAEQSAKRLGLEWPQPPDQLPAKFLKKCEE